MTFRIELKNIRLQRVPTATRFGVDQTSPRRYLITFSFKSRLTHIQTKRTSR